MEEHTHHGSNDNSKECSYNKSADSVLTLEEDGILESRLRHDFFANAVRFGVKAEYIQKFENSLDDDHLSFGKQLDAISSEEREYQKYRIDYLVKCVELEELQEEYDIQDGDDIARSKQEMETEINKVKDEVEIARQQLYQAEDRFLQSFNKEKDT